MREYAVFHDESKEDAYWHVFFWVPLDFIDELVDCLRVSQNRSGYRGKQLSYKRLGVSPTKHRCAHYWLTVLKASLHNQKPHHLADFDMGRALDRAKRKWRPFYRRFSRMPCCKVNVFYLPNGHEDLDLCKDETARIETTFRMGLKGGAHYLFSEDIPCQISNIWLDREKHYQRPLEKEKLLGRLRNETRDYVSLADGCRIEGEGVPDAERLILDAVDVLLGSFRHAHFHGRSDSSKAKVRKYKLTQVIMDLLKKLNRGDGMRNSRFFKGYSFSQAKLVSGRWEFSPLHQEIIDAVEPASDQLTFF